MYKWFAPLLVALAATVASADCCSVACCPQPEPCCRPRMQLRVVCVEKQVVRMKRVCTVDACGCPCVKWVPCCETVTRRRLCRVPCGC